MTPAEYQQVRSIVDQALSLSGGERQAFLDSVFRTEPEIRAEVESLLKACIEAGDFLEEPAAKIDPMAGEDFGSYRVERLIGVGGMGAVYEASRRDGQFLMKAAIKIVKHELNSEIILKRFRNERQILARLSHPNVARLIDGGVTRLGRPYFVMEFVDGQRLDQFARGLGLNQRLDLFRTICKAVHYAHQNLVVHGDLKTSNILVEADGTPKLLDFGIARLLDPDLQGGMTVTLMPAAFTPEYASPEQMRGEPLSTASDIYSLGVLLCELLSGGRPYSFTTQSTDLILRDMRAKPPRKPSEIADDDRLAGDLDNIVLKALQIEPSWRYASAEQMAEDVRRYQAGLPVIARPDSFTYRASKFVLRNRLAVAAAVLAVVGLAGGLGVAAWQARVAREEKARAERRFRDVRDIANAFIFELESDIAALPGSTAVRGKLIGKATQYLDRLAQDSESDPELSRELAAAFQKLGDVQGRAGGANLGETQAALESYRKSMEIRELLAARDPKNPQPRHDLAEAYVRYSGILKVKGDYQGGIDLDRKALALREELLKSHPENRDFLRALAYSYTSFGGSLSQIGDWAGVLEARRKALELYRTLNADNPTISDQKGLALAVSRFAGILHRNGERAQAVRSYQESLGIYAAILRKLPNDTDTKLGLSAAETALGGALADDGDPVRAIAMLQQACNRYESIVAQDPKETRARSTFSTALLRLGEAFLKSGAPARALAPLERTRELREVLAAESPSNAGAQGQVAEAYLSLGDALEALGRNDEAVAKFRHAANIAFELNRTKRANTHMRTIFKNATAGLARLHAER